MQSSEVKEIDFPVSKKFIVRKFTKTGDDGWMYLIHKDCGGEVYRCNSGGDISCYYCNARPGKKTINKCNFLGVQFD